MEKKNNNNAIILVLSILLSFFCGTIGSYLVITNVPSVTKSIIENVSKVELTENSIALAVEKVYDGVITVASYKNGEQISTGSGFVYKKDNRYGYIMTNNHVVDGADKVEVILSNNKRVEAKILGKETYSDIAVLSIDEKEVLSVVEIGVNEDMKLGDTVFTIGAPMGIEYSGTVTKGILSGKDRLIEVSFSGSTSDYYMKVLQTDAAINPGNSGGPLLNVNGDVIGINSLKLVQEQVEGMGFAIPIEDAMSYVDLLKEGKAIQRPVMGVQILDLTNPYMLYRYGFKIDSNVDEGILLVKLNDNYPASNAGLKAGDIITKINGEKVNTTAKFKYELYKYSLDETIEVTYFRNGKEKKVKVKLDKAG